MGLLWWLISSFGSHGVAFLLGILAIPGTIVFLFPEILTIVYKELVVKGILFDSPKYKSASEIPIPALDGEDKSTEEEKDAPASTANSRVSGWLIVRRQYKPSKEGILFTNATTDLTGAQKRQEKKLSEDTTGVRSGQEGEDDEPKLDADAASIMTTDSGSGSINSNKPGAASTASQRSWVQAARQTLTLPKREAPAKERFYCVLKGSVLYLYEDEKQSDALAVLAVDRFNVTVETSGGRFSGKDGEMFAKKNAVVMRLWEGEKDKVDKGTSMPVVARGMTGEVDRDHEGNNDMEKAPWFLMSKNNSQLEDWYLALVQASTLHPSMADVFSYEDMQDLVKTIDAEQDPIPTRWLNAILGRVFFGLYRTAFVEEFIIGRIMKKLNKVVKPNWLSDISVQEVNIGTFPPFFSKPMLKDLRSDGSITFEAYLRYVARENQPNSKIRLTMAFLATIPVGFKSIQVPVVAAVIVRAMEGNMIFTIKPAPSNRIWYGFTTEPVMDIEISLMGAEWKVESSFILNQLKKFLKQAIAEVLVAPNFDDLAFFDTSKFNVRGGIFSEAGKVNSKSEREDVTIKGGPTSQPSVVAKEGSDVGKGSKRQSTHGDLGKISSGEEKTGTIPKVQTETGLDNKTLSGLGRASSTSSRSMETARPKRSLPTRPSTVHYDNSVMESTEASASAPILISEPADTIVSSPASDRATTITSGFHPFPTTNTNTKPASIRSTDTRSSTSTSTTTGTAKEPESSHPEGDIDRSASPGGAASSASLLDSFRARDKQAIAAQVNTARSVVKKWGIDFAAKRRADFNQTSQPGTGIKGQTPATGQTQPQAIYRPDDDRLHTQSATGTSPASLGHSPNRTLQERLHDAARAAAAANSSSNNGRERSGSTLSTNTASSAGSSRPTLLASPSKSGVVEASPSISEPSFTLSSQRTDNPSTSTSTATSPPVLMQPSAGRSMVVPRVVRRPGEVTGLGNSPAQGVIRKTSDTPPNDTHAPLLPPTSTLSGKATPPDLPPRKSVESDRPLFDMNDNETVPPPLPSRRFDPVSAAENGSEVQGSDPAPAPMATTPHSSDTSTPASNDNTQSGQADVPSQVEEASSLPEPHTQPVNLGSSTAQDSLRKLAEKNNQSRKEKEKEQPLALDGEA